MQKISISFLTLVLVICSWNINNAQTQQALAKPCATEESDQFDFWLGEWDLTWPAEQFGGTAGEKGKGTNIITQPLGECVIQEAFRSPAGQFNGHSVSVYVPRQKVWKQTWVDNQGGYLLFTGEFKDGRMELRTKPVERKGKTNISRMVFRNIKKNSLNWDWQHSTDGGTTWTDLWNIHYKRKKVEISGR